LKQNSFLYGDGVEIAPVPHGVIDERITALQKHLKILMDVEMMERDNNRINAVSKAISFWNKLGKKDK